MPSRNRVDLPPGAAEGSELALKLPDWHSSRDPQEKEQRPWSAALRVVHHRVGLDSQSAGWR